MSSPDHREFANQHKTLQGEIERIQASDLSRPDTDGDKVGQTELRRAIRSFRASLREHFAFEEEEDGGYLRQVTIVRPTLSRNVARLRGDHDAILAALDELERGSNQNQSCESIKASFVATVRRLRKHETEEMDLLQHAIMHDLGVGD